MNHDHNANNRRTVCPSCSSKDTTVFHRVDSTPVNSVMNVYTREDALAFPCGEIALAHCSLCGFVYNSKFEPEKVRYNSDCEESQGYSPTFSAFARDLAQNLIDKHNLRGKRIIEIGCGKGEFLQLMHTLGENSGVGFDPAYVAGRGDASDDDAIQFIADYYSEKYAHFHGDMICCRMTLEHIDETAELIRTVRRSIGDRKDTIVFFQVPEVTRILEECAFEDIYYEHCSYFSPGSLARLFRASQFEVTDLQVVYDGQYLLIEAKPADEVTSTRLELEDDLQTVNELVSTFQHRNPTTIRHWSGVLEKIKKQDGRVVLWGSGSKGVAFLHAVDHPEQVQYVVDINPHRQGTFMPGTGQKIVAPDFLTAYQPDAVIVMNKVYVDEISTDLRKRGLSPQIYALGA